MTNDKIVWSDDRIREAVKLNTTAIEDFRLMKRIRDDYEEILDMVIAQRDQLAASLMAIESHSRTIA